MCLHSEKEVRFYLDRKPKLSAVITRRRDGRFLAGWLVDPRKVSDITFTIAALLDWHPSPGATVDLSLVNQHRVSRGYPALDERGLPIYSGELPPSAEETPIGQDIKDLLARFSEHAYEDAVA